MLVVAPFILVHISILMLNPIECHDERERERETRPSNTKTLTPL